MPETLKAPIRTLIYALVGLTIYLSFLTDRVEEWVPGTTYDVPAKAVAVAAAGVIIAVVNWLANLILAKLGVSTPTYVKLAPE